MLKTLRSLFAAPEPAVPKPPREEYVSPRDKHARAIHDFLLSAVLDRALSESEIAAIVLAEAITLNGEIVTLGWPSEVDYVFERFLSEGVSFRSYVEERTEAASRARAEGIFESRAAVGWHFALSDDFIRSIERIDKKLQGRVLEAITKIAQSPTTAMGDTIKPLGADLKGLWRYRVGDYRLVYAPDQQTGHITLMSFEARGDVYS